MRHTLWCFFETHIIVHGMIHVDVHGMVQVVVLG
jgi:hypothetical protein